MASNANFSILAKVELDTKDIQSQLNKAGKIGAQSGDGIGLSFQAANAILRTTVDIIGSMSEQVYELNGAITEFKKVSDLQGASLDNYVSKLSDMGQQVARTGKPWCLSRNVQMVNVH